MSWDYSVLVRGRKRKPEAIREIAARLAESYEGTLVAYEDDQDDEDDADDLDVHVAFKGGGGGTIEITRLKHGYQLYLDSQRDGNRDSWEDIGGLANDLASKLGTVIEDRELVARMIEESEPDEVAPLAASPLADLAVVLVEARGGELHHELSIAVGAILRAIDGGGMLRDDELAGYPLLAEEGRYTARVARVIATLHDRYGEAYRRHRWSCDGYGRIISADVEEL